MILIATNQRDLTSDYVVLELRRRGIPFFRLNTENISKGIVSYNPHKCARAWEFDIEDEKLDFLTIDAAYYRRPEPPLPPAFVHGDAERRYCSDEWGEMLSSALYSVGNRWLNPLGALREAENKPRQLAIANTLGFRVPTTLVTNNPSAVDEFISRGATIVKPLKASLLIENNIEKVIFTRRLTNTSITEHSIRAAPFILQSEIEKKFDIRATVVGNSVFAAEIHSQEQRETVVDWRKNPTTDLLHQSHDLPTEIQEKCVQITQHLGLRFGAIDLILDNSGLYWFLEINPNGQWAWIENRTKLPITRAIVDELERIAKC